MLFFKKERLVLWKWITFIIIHFKLHGKIYKSKKNDPKSPSRDKPCWLLVHIPLDLLFQKIVIIANTHWTLICARIVLKCFKSLQPCVIVLFLQMRQRAGSNLPKVIQIVSGGGAFQMKRPRLGKLKLSS